MARSRESGRSRGGRLSAVTADAKTKIQGTLALWVVVFSGAMVAGLAAYVIAVSDDPIVASDVLKTVLPVFTAWVSTVLVFYFGQKSFEAASAL